MFTVKITGIILLVAVCSMWGFLKSFSLNARCKKMSAFCDGLDTLYVHIEQGGCELDAAIKNSFCKCDFITVEKGKALCKDSDLTFDDKAVINDFLSSLGKSAKKAECDRIISFSHSIKKRLNDAECDAVQKSKLFKTFGVCIGLALGVLLI